MHDAKRRGNQLCKHTDGRYNVVAECIKGTTKCRTRSWFTGHRKETEATDIFPTPELAIEAAANEWAAYTRGEFETMVAPETLGELFELWLTQPDVPEMTRTNRDTHTRPIITALGEARALPHVSYHLIRALFDGKGWKPHTWNNARGRLAQLFEFAVANGWSSDNPARRLPRREHEGVIRPWLQYCDWPALLAVIPDDEWRCRVEFSLETGLRAGELRHARREWIRTGAMTPTITVQADPASNWKPKTKHSRRTVPLSPRAVELATWASKRWADEPWAFFDARTKARSGLSHRMHRYCAAASVTDIDWHGLRRSAGGRWLESGVPITVVKKWLGHSSIAVTERCYADVSDVLSAHAISLVAQHADAYSTGKVVPLRPAQVVPTAP